MIFLAKPVKALLKIKNPFALLLGLIILLRNYILYLVFRFDKWHIQSNFYLRPYKKVVVKIVNIIKADCVIELGCGLSDILCRVNSKRKIGIDIDINVINACRFIHRYKNIYYNNSILNLGQPQSDYTSNNTYKNLLICINFPHIYDWNTIEADIKNLTNIYQINYLVIDLLKYNVLRKDIYYHTEEMLLTIGEIIKSEEMKGSNRIIYLVKLYN